MSELETGLAAAANEPVADTTTIDAALDAAFDPPSEPAAGSEPPASPNPEIKPVAATQLPQDTAKPDGAKGEPPRERWDAILSNARTKAREETLAEYRDHLEIVNRLKTDFTGTLAQLLEEGAGDPRFSEALTSRAAAILSARNKQAKANIEPEPDLQTADGAQVYSADQLRKWHQWNQGQSEQKLNEQFKPLRELQTQIQQSREVQQMAKEAADVATERGGQWKQMPFFAEHQGAILTRQQAIYTEMQAQGQRGERRFDPTNAPWDALAQAYREVVSTQAVPKLQTQQTNALVADAARKRAGSSSDPAASAPAQPRKPRTVDEALDQVFGAIA